MSDPGLEQGRRLDEFQPATSSATNGRPAAPVQHGPPVSQTGPALQLDVVTARELCHRPDPPRSADLLGPVLRRGARTVVGGATITGDGKTTLCLHMLAAAVRGADFLGWQGHGDLRALVLDLEQGESSLKRALREAGLDDREDVDVVRVPDGLMLDRNVHHREELARVLEAGLYDVTLIDPTYKVQSGNWNDEEHVVAVMRLLDGWRERFEFALLMATHSRKRQVGNGSFSIDDLFGSSAFVRGCEVVLGIQLVEEGVSKLHFLKDRDGALPVRGTMWTLDFDREEGYRISDRPAAGEWVKASPAEIATWVKERGGATPGEILAEFDMGKSALSTRRAELEQHGLRYVSAGAKTRYEPALEPLLPDPPPGGGGR
jgi:hypothetical protein